MGPFKNPVNRLVSKLFLPKVRTIIARGDYTFENLSQLHLTNVVQGTDMAFLLNNPSKSDALRANEPVSIDRFVKGADNVVGIAPSIVVQKKATKRGIDYIGVMSEIVARQLEQDRAVVLLPHSFRKDETKLHNNDGPLTAQIASRFAGNSNVLFVNTDLGPEELRYVISKCNVFLACRFHAMVSSLSMAVPTLVLGWGHKYAEILKLFKQEEQAIDFSEIEADMITKKIDEMVVRQEVVRRTLKKHLPKVVELSLSTHSSAIGGVLKET
jgi:polysaccharide pyruvyl transferase WcaK-like protein